MDTPTKYRTDRLDGGHFVPNEFAPPVAAGIAAQFGQEARHG